MQSTAATVWRDFQTDGLPSSGAHQPVKREIRELFAPIEAAVNSFLTNGGLIYLTLNELNSDLARGPYVMAWVIADPVVAANGIYQKQGGAGFGSWLRVSDLPFTFIKATDSGAGTANAIIATSTLPISNDTLVAFNVFEANTASPVTVAFNGAAPLTIKTAAGNDPSPGGLVTGMALLGYKQTTQFRLLSDQASAAIQSACETAAIEAEAARDLAVAAADQAAVEGAGDVPMMPNRTYAAAATIPAERTYIQIQGFAATADRGAGLYKKLGAAPSPAKLWHFQSSGATAAWWELADRVLDARMLGFGVASATVNVDALLACIEYAKTFGVSEIRLPEGQWNLNNTINLNSDGVVIRGTVPASYHDEPAASSARRGTRLGWTGPANEPMFHLAPIEGAGPGLSGCGIHDLYLDGNLTSGPLLKLRSLKYCRFSGMFLTRANFQAALLCDVVATLGEAADLQNTTFQDFVIDQRTGAGNADCLWLTGNADANTSYNIFSNFLAFHGTTNGLALLNCDNCDFDQVRCYRVGGSGLGLLLAGSTVAGDVIGAYTARNNTFHRLFSASGVFSQGLDSAGVVFPANNNRIWEYDLSNGSPLPAIGTGSNLMWTPDTARAYTLGTSGYLSQENGLIEEWGVQVVAPGTVVNVTLPLAFPTTALNAQCTMAGSGAVTHTSPPQAEFTDNGHMNIANMSAHSATVFWRAYGK